MIEYFVLLAGLLALSAFFSSSETAYLSIEGVRLEHERQRRLPGADRAARLLAEPRRLLASILVGNNLVNTGAATVGAVIAQELVGGSGGLSIVVATVTVTVLLVIFGEIGPKSVALHHNMTMARYYSLPLIWWSRLIAPAVASLDWLSRIWLRIVGGADEAHSALSLGELRTAIVQARDEGELAGQDTSLLLGALRLGETQVRRIMTPRPQIASIDSAASLEQAGVAFGEAGFLRLPVRYGSADDYIGYLHGSDVVAELGRGNRESPRARGHARRPDRVRARLGPARAQYDAAHRQPPHAPDRRVRRDHRTGHAGGHPRAGRRQHPQRDPGRLGAGPP